MAQEDQTLDDQLQEAKHGRKLARKKEQKTEELSESEQLRKTIEFAPARAVLVRLLVKARIHHSSMVLGENSQDMAFREGKKQMGIELLEDIAKVSPRHRNLVLGEYYDRTSGTNGDAGKSK